MYLWFVDKVQFFFTDLCGDQVVVINTQDIALRGDEWQKRQYFHHTTYHHGASWTKAWELHKKNPTKVNFVQTLCWQVTCAFAVLYLKNCLNLIILYPDYRKSHL